MLHITRALLAAAVSCIICSMLIEARSVLVVARFADMSLNGFLNSLPRSLPKDFLYSTLLILLISLPMAILWMLPRSRCVVSNPWAAAIVGAIIALLVSPVWNACRFMGHEVNWSSAFFWKDYLGGTPYVPLVAAATGGTYFFLHSLFIQHARAKKFWLETHPR